MRNYTLLNKGIDKRLIHPKVGLWFTSDLEEAKDMLKACHEYLEAIKAGSIKDEFVIIDAETGEEILS